MSMIDATGQPRSDEEIQEAIGCVKTIMVKHPTALPLFTVHALLLMDCLRELQALRQLKQEKAHPTTTINKLKLILESQVEDPENWPKVTPVIEPSSEKDAENILHLVLRKQQVGFSFDVTGTRFLGIYNWKD